MTFARILITLLLTLPFAASATQTRSRGLGLSTDTSWMVQGQYPYLFLNPAAVNDYRNFIYFEHQLNSVSIEENSGGVFFNPYDKLTFGFLTGLPVNQKVFNDSANPRSLFYSSGTNLISNNVIFDLNNAIITANGLSLAESFNLYDVSRNEFNNRNINTVLGYEMSNLQLGALIGYGYVKDNQSRANLLKEYIRLFKSETSVTAGARYQKNLWRFESIDLAYSMVLYDLNNNYDSTDIDGLRIAASLTDDAAQDHSIFVKTSFRLHRRHLLHLSYRFASYRTATTATAKSEINVPPLLPFEYVENYSRTGHSHRLGISDEMHPAKTVKVYFGIQVDTESLSNSYDGLDIQSGRYRQNPVEENFNSLFVPVYLGLEGELSKYFTIRFALNHSLHNRPAATYDREFIDNRRGNTSSANITQTNITTTTGSGGAESNVSLGFTLNFSRFSIDWLANANFFRDGPHFFSGKVNELSTALAVSYYFVKGDKK